MHKFLGAVGFSKVGKKSLEEILNSIIERPDSIGRTTDSEGNEYVELKEEFGHKFGIKVCGTYDEDGNFKMDYFYPYLISEIMTTAEVIEVQKHVDRESYAGICDEPNLGVTLIFQIENTINYLEVKRLNENAVVKGATMSALAFEGKILLPVISYDNENLLSGSTERSQLVAKAREGDTDAIENLTLDDMDTYSLLSKRIKNEDVMTIVTSSFMPYGVESDQYSVLGQIVECNSYKNKLTNETVYVMKLICNDLAFDVAINENALLGEPMVGRRFKGNIWMMGRVMTF